MGYFVTKQTDATTTYVSELIADTKGDLADINTSNFAVGTICIVIEDSSVYILDTNKEWKPL